jgi:hypothetical protein
MSSRPYTKNKIGEPGMQVTKSKLKKIIKEELQRVLMEA